MQTGGRGADGQKTHRAQLRAVRRGRFRHINRCVSSLRVGEGRAPLPPLLFFCRTEGTRSHSQGPAVQSTPGPFCGRPSRLEARASAGQSLGSRPSAISGGCSPGGLWELTPAPVLHGAPPVPTIHEVRAEPISFRESAIWVVAGKCLRAQPSADPGCGSGGPRVKHCPQAAALTPGAGSLCCHEPQP